MTQVRWRSAAALAGALVLVSLAAQPAAATTRYSLANGCYALRTGDGRFVAKDALGYHANATSLAAATKFRMQATALGRYLMFGPDATMPAVGPLGTVVSTSQPGPSADWTMQQPRPPGWSFTALTNGRGLAVGLGGRLTQVAATSATPFLFSEATGCARFPEIDVNVTGTPFKGSSPTAPVRGFVDDHIHLGAYEFLGGRFHCGRPWSPYGVTVAMRDCVDHQPNGAGAAVENFLSAGSPVGTHSTEGWSTFAGWPRAESLTHEGSYWKWIERSWRGGLRIMVNDLVENRALCELYPLKRNSCDEMASARLQARGMRELQDYIDAQYGGPGKGFLRIVRSPAEARRVINEGKLAMVFGMETSELFGCGQFNGTPRCDAAQIDRQLAEFHALGVRSAFPVHKFDNALGGTRYDNGATGVLVNAGNKYATGQFWQPEQCTDPDHDNEPTNVEPLAAVIAPMLDPVTSQGLFAGQLPVYPPGPLCNPKGLSALGDHLIQRMMQRGMIVETDHLSMRARRDALALLEARSYPGVISSHSWGDSTSLGRILRLGGMVGPYAGTTEEFKAHWEEARAKRDPRFLFGVGFGSDINGLGAQGGPRPGAAANPVRYPFRTFDGGSVVNRNTSGWRSWDINTDGVDHYGLYPDWVEDLRIIAGPQIVTDLANGAEAYLQMWQRAEAAGRRIAAGG
jgi:microsomal dipeptidase-like Zn-dependent dipeptidase